MWLVLKSKTLSVLSNLHVFDIDIKVCSELCSEVCSGYRSTTACMCIKKDHE